jgi:hypothetical protein
MTEGETITAQMATIGECRYWWLRLPATKITRQMRQLRLFCRVFHAAMTARMTTAIPTVSSRSAKQFPFLHMTRLAHEAAPTLG